ncbi:MAG: hypothetical protein H8D47_01540 [Planctomycetes bacterium]|nr:hypothetical protein [Planctomycetota bacterium]
MSLKLTIYEEASGYCGKCLKQVPVVREKTNILPNVLLTLLTCGLWVIFWIKIAKKLGPWYCFDCGGEVYKVMN